MNEIGAIKNGVVVLKKISIKTVRRACLTTIKTKI